VAQGEGPEFKPQYIKKGKITNIDEDMEKLEIRTYILLV
jgi:hypothetical protein